MNEEQRNLACRLIKEGKSISEVARTFSIHPATLYRVQGLRMKYRARFAVGMRFRAYLIVGGKCGCRDFDINGLSVCKISMLPFFHFSTYPHIYPH
jgi:hypothetical protein